MRRQFLRLRVPRLVLVSSPVQITSRRNFKLIAHSDLLMLGPVDAVDESNARAQVLGQWIQLSPSRRPKGLVGRVLAIYGSVAADGSLEVTAAREQNSVDYVPGATRVFLKGSIAEIDCSAWYRANWFALCSLFKRTPHSRRRRPGRWSRRLSLPGCAIPMRIRNFTRIVGWCIAPEPLGEPEVVSKR